MIDYLSTLIQSNPIFAGGAAMAFFGWVVMQARNLPQQIFTLLRSTMTTSLTVYSEDSIFRQFELWLSVHPGSTRSRRLSVTPFHNQVSDESDHKLTPGAGIHLIRHKGRFILVIKTVNENATSKADAFNTEGLRRQTLELVTLGRKQEPFWELLEEVKAVKEDRDTIPIKLWNEYDYQRLDRRIKRPLDTIYIDRKVKEGLVQDMQSFFAKKDWYNTNAIPFRRGYFFDGPPGTGKSSLIFALASLFNKEVHIINLATVRDDNYLLKAVNAAGPNFVVLEDIDVHKIVSDRKDKTVEKEERNPGEGPGITYSGLLNALDGIGAREGRILFITSNHREKLDAALLRPGRIDRIVHLGHAGEEQAREMFRRLNTVDDNEDEWIAQISGELPLPAAELQNRLLARSMETIDNG